MPQLRISDAAELLDVSDDTVRRMSGSRRLDTTKDGTPISKLDHVIARHLVPERRRESIDVPLGGVERSHPADLTG